MPILPKLKLALFFQFSFTAGFARPHALLRKAKYWDADGAEKKFILSRRRRIWESNFHIFRLAF